MLGTLGMQDLMWFLKIISPVSKDKNDNFENYSESPFVLIVWELSLSSQYNDPLKLSACTGLPKKNKVQIKMQE